MPTLTFYADDETALKLKELLEKKSQLAGYKVTSGKLFSAHIKDEYKRLCHPLIVKPTPAVDVKRSPRKAKSSAARVPAL